MPPSGVLPAATPPLLLGSMSPTTQRMPLGGPVEVSSITNSTSAAALAGTFCHCRGGLMFAPSHVYVLGSAPFAANAGLEIVSAPGRDGGSSPLALGAAETDG